jgi:hypothetical protein
VARPTAKQRRQIEKADPNTGLLAGTAGQLEALVAAGWAFRHPAPPRRCYLTPAGWKLREEILRPPSDRPAAASPDVASRGVFTARSGNEPVPADPGRREREVRSAWEGLLELRRMTNCGGDTAIPGPWERTHLLSAAGLALEAAGCAPSGVDAGGQRTAGGYLVSQWPQADTVRVEWAGPERWPAAAGVAGLEDALVEFAGALEGAGWQVSQHRAACDRAVFLLASPRRV